MPVNAALVGVDLPALEPYAVSREKIREFARAIGDESPASFDPAAARALGHPDVVAPPTFAMVVAHLAGQIVVGHPDLDLDYSRVVHGEQRFAHTRPIVAGDVLAGSPRLTAVRLVAGSEFVTWAIDLVDAGGAPVTTATTMLVVRGADQATDGGAA